MKITNVSHYISIAGKDMCAENIHFIVEGAKLEVLAQLDFQGRDKEGNIIYNSQKRYKNWLKAAEVEKPSHNKRRPAIKTAAVR
jgi:hypothetical protein